MTPRPLTPQSALALLTTLGAPAHLLRHVGLVSEAAEQLLEAIAAMGFDLDGDYVRVGVTLHDVGKIVHPRELHGAGNAHEQAGLEMLTEAGIEDRVARVCLTHARWEEAGSTEELVIALADKLWKGKRHTPLEDALVDALHARRPQASRWQLMLTMDTLFEDVAARGSARLLRSETFETDAI